jgi:hypothetical protein
LLQLCSNLRNSKLGCPASSTQPLLQQLPGLLGLQQLTPLLLQLLLQLLQLQLAPICCCVKLRSDCCQVAGQLAGVC